jgi:hypothetical protein
MSLLTHAHHLLGNVAVELVLGLILFVVACKAVAAIWGFCVHGSSWWLPNGLFRSSALGLFWVVLSVLAVACATDYMQHFSGKAQMINPTTATHAVADMYALVVGMAMLASAGALFICGLGAILFGMTEAVVRRDDRRRTHAVLHG